MRAQGWKRVNEKRLRNWEGRSPDRPTRRSRALLHGRTRMSLDGAARCASSGGLETAAPSHYPAITGVFANAAFNDPISDVIVSTVSSPMFEMRNVLPFSFP